MTSKAVPLRLRTAILIAITIIVILPFIFLTAAANVSNRSEGSASPLRGISPRLITNYSQPLVLPLSTVQRIVQARVYQVGAWTLSKEDANSVGIALANLHPSYVAGLLHIKYNETLSAQEIQAYNTVRNLVLQASPNAKFDVFLTAIQYNTSQQIVSEMKYINSKIKINIFYFDFYYKEYEANPQVMKAAILYAHSRAQYIGGNVWGPEVPPGSDFVATNDVNFTVSYRLVTKLEQYGIPVLLDLNNNPQNNGSSVLTGNGDPWAESCYFMQVWHEHQRISYITKLAENQSSWGYDFMYPVFFPDCPTAVSYDSVMDKALGTSTYDAIASLVREYNSNSKVATVVTNLTLLMISRSTTGAGLSTSTISRISMTSSSFCP
jgi:hypothetical protein